jgi:HAD superfamily hydrolase (TIGR01509 family)
MKTRSTLTIFDMDGVLVDLCEIHRRTFQKALSILCDIGVSHEAYLQRKELEGLPTKTKCSLLGLSEDETRRVNTKKQELTMRALRDLHPNRRVIEAVCTARDFGPVACYSNSVKQTVEMALSRTGVLNLFDFILSNEGVKSCKPNPEGYFKIMAWANHEPDETVIFEDSPVGIKGALTSGAHVVKVISMETDVCATSVRRVHSEISRGVYKST